MAPITTDDAHNLDWDALLESLTPVDLLILEQVYSIEGMPVSLQLLQSRLTYLNVHERTVARHALDLADRGLLSAVTSCEVIFNPVLRHAHNARQLVAIWRLREQRSLALNMAELTPARSNGPADPPGPHEV